ncbi:peptidoglycan/LPS O-acetylase OafA/YrhL [Microbacterium resistens]|uniref:Peptidoglycan/LPS O-acetylase OafA/YrhL n=1 Tax=Microbacterium resistens TaxID=156977 RepID=A0ABU1S9P9_9MICO|nr:acyltransferase family protein [Microbacterium resistens]MDR6866329.1 peptidoglycan/LPS O-acetylase OafA/YrhL [Microbacterium resistens]
MSAPEATPPRALYRHDIDGLRAVAILLVVVYHVWIGRVSGGVDVFLMISAFFLTLSFVRRIESGSPLRIVSFLAGRFRRLLPAAAVAIALTLGAGWLLMPATAWPSLWREGWASLGYFQNWVLAGEGVDYYARDSVLASPLQHFWSLSVQGQVFVLWPVIFLLGALLVRWTRRSATVILAVLFGILFAASLAFSIVETQSLQSFAYFDTRTRLWEFAAGSLVALMVPHIRLNRVLGAILGWVGLAAIVACGMVIDVRGGFPGYLALWPVIATALVILSGAQETAGGPARFLAARPVRAAGRDAYALYLVHWPVLILWLTVRRETHASFLDGAAIIAISLLLARLLTMFVERPLRLPAGERGSLPRNLGVIAACVALVAAVSVPWQVSARAQAQAYAEAHAEDYLGAGAIDDGDATRVGDTDAPLLPQPIDLEDEWVSLPDYCSGRLAPAASSLRDTCTQTSGADRAEKLIVVIGDSHAEQMTGALLPVAEKKGWGVMSLLLGGCSLEYRAPGTDENGEPVEPDECARWQQDALAHALAMSPDSVFTMVTRSSPDSADERVLEGIGDVADLFTGAGIRVFGMRDNPRSANDLYTCALEELDCDRPQGEVLQEVNPAEALSDRMTLLDFTPWLCPGGICRTEIGNVAVYLDDNHLTHAFTKTLAPAMRSQLGEYAQ